MLIIKSLYQKVADLEKEKEKKEAAVVVREEKLHTQQNEATQKSADFKQPSDVTTTQPQDTSVGPAIKTPSLLKNNFGNQTDSSFFPIPHPEQQHFYHQQVVEAQISAVIAERDLAYRHLQDLKSACIRRGFFVISLLFFKKVK
jgi:hypothetical protein